jgi:putative flippase GtrA
MGLLGLMDALVHAHPALSVTAAYTGAMVVYYLLSKHMVFVGEQAHKAGTGAVQFAAVVIINFVVTQIIVNWIHSLTGEVYLGSLLAGAVTISLSYIVFDRVVFKRSQA